MIQTYVIIEKSIVAFKLGREEKNLKIGKIDR